MTSEIVESRLIRESEILRSLDGARLEIDARLVAKHSSRMRRVRGDVEQVSGMESELATSDVHLEIARHQTDQLTCPVRLMRVTLPWRSLLATDTGNANAKQLPVHGQRAK